MVSAGVGKDGRRGNRTQQGSMVTVVVVVGIVKFQRGEGVRVNERNETGEDETIVGIRG